ncbi:nuclear transport factor 2 family protein [Dactylosporangium sp. NPDC049140]|uniref:nuclear transport factor 2 family protein n=1 Tax=Dactylosporangium sp. NPDC049140 TaxID=3155647 RepID=UPI0033E28309
MDVVAALQEHLDRLTFADRGTDEVTELLIAATVEWATASGWRAYRRARSVVPLPPPYEQQFSVVDVGVARPSAPPLVIEVDHADRRRTLDKLAAEAAAGREALWVRWGSGRLTVPPPPIRLVPFPVISRRGPSGARVHSHTANTNRPAPAHTTPQGSYSIVPMDPDIDLVLRAYAAFAAGDIAAAVRDLAPDVVWIEPDEFPDGGRHDGRAAVARYLQASYDSWRELHSSPAAARAGDSIVVVHRVHGVLADGTEHTAVATDVFTVVEGRVVRMEAQAGG